MAFLTLHQFAGAENRARKPLFILVSINGKVSRADLEGPRFAIYHCPDETRHRFMLVRGRPVFDI
jgi:hypothetical protein